MALFQGFEQVVEAGDGHARGGPEFGAIGVEGGGVADGVGFVGTEGRVDSGLQSGCGDPFVNFEGVRGVVGRAGDRDFLGIQNLVNGLKRQLRVGFFPHGLGR